MGDTAAEVAMSCGHQRDIRQLLDTASSLMESRLNPYICGVKSGFFQLRRFISIRRMLGIGCKSHR